MFKRCLHKLALAVLAAAALSTANGPALADQTHSTITLAAGATSPAFALPIANSPIIITCAQTVSGNVGTGMLTVIRSTADGYPVWNGYDVHGAITGGQNIAQHMVSCDFGNGVELRSLSVSQFVVHNGASTSQTVVIMMVY